MGVKVGEGVWENGKLRWLEPLPPWVTTRDCVLSYGSVMSCHVVQRQDVDYSPVSCCSVMSCDAAPSHDAHTHPYNVFLQENPQMISDHSILNKCSYVLTQNAPRDLINI